MYTASPNIVVPVEGQEFTITEGSNRSITCTATGYPPPTVVWQNSDGSSLRLVSGSEVMSSTGVGNVTSVSVELMVTGAMRIDTGMYRCSASNFASNDTDVTVTITVQCKYIITVCICQLIKQRKLNFEQYHKSNETREVTLAATLVGINLYFQSIVYPWLK